ncbi:MAG: tetratricopeptide repeat protein [Bacteroidia bacterium]|jgi:tetratricopeptide (TPR) repeat protein|nr:tetratricopeptide repeat protein [Bacteroidia bacterium]
MNKNTDIIHLLNLAEEDEGAFRKAIRDCTAEELEEFSRESYRLYPNRSWPLIVCAQALSYRNSDDVVARIMEIALRMEPVDFHAITNYARALHLTGRYSEIVPHIDKYLPREEDKEQALLLYHKANVLFDLGQTEEAVLLATEAYRTYSESDEVVFIYGYAMYMQKKYADALVYYNKVISLAPDMKIIWLYIALVHIDCGDFTSAVNAIRKLSESESVNFEYMTEFPQFEQLLKSEQGAEVRELYRQNGIMLK